MDIKLKNKHRLGIFLTWLLIIAAGAGMVCSYPYIQRMAREWETNNKKIVTEMGDQSRSSNLAAELTAASYAMWEYEIEEASVKKLRPSQVFVPELEEMLAKLDGETAETRPEAAGEEGMSEETAEEDTVYAYEGDPYGEDYDSFYQKEFLLEVRSYIDGQASAWDSALEEIGGPEAVRVLDGTGNVLLSGNRGSYGSDLDENRQVMAAISFDDKGRSSLTEVQGDPRAVQILTDNSGYFKDMADPLEEEYGADYVYQGIEFSGPRQRTYEFVVDKEMILGPEITETEALGYYSFVNSGTFMVVWVALALLVGLCALIIPALPVVSLGTGRISRVPLGIILAVLFCDAFMVLGGAAMLVLTFSGELADALAAGLGFGTWDDAVLFANGIYWGITFAAVFWAALCMRAVFVMGPWRYFKERTLTGLFLRLVKRTFAAVGRWWNQFMDSLGKLDWSEKSNQVIVKIVLANFFVLVLICCFWFFGIFALIVYSVVLFFILRRYWEKARQKYQILLTAINEMADGNLDVEIKEDLWIFAPFYQQLTRIQKGFKKAVQEEVKSQRMKTELVTNVSHDLKTPLTAIITYVNLLKKEDVTEEERKNYIDILEKKSMRLKSLIEDLFEVSKATSGAATVKLENVDIVSLLKQVRLELQDRIDNSGVEFRWDLPEEKVVLLLDSQKTYRVFENLLVNIIKYAMPGTRAYIDVKAETGDDGSGEAVVSMRNISAQELQVNPRELTERFVRGDASRNTEGSGLGLAIAKSFVELQGGTMTVEVEADLFRVIIRWNISRSTEEN